LSESELPLVPPPLEDYKPTGTGEPPLRRRKIGFGIGQGDARIKRDAAMAGSCLVLLRFLRPAERSALRRRKKQKNIDGRTEAGGVDLYVGGTEQPFLHLLYARFWHKCSLISVTYRSRSRFSAS